MQTPNILKLLVTNPLPQLARQFVQKEFRRITIDAGYQDNHGVIFQGDINQAIYGRESPTDTLLTVYAADGDHAHNYATVSTTHPPGSKPQDHLNTALQAMQPFGISKGFIGVDLSQPVYPRAVTLFGMARDVLANIAKTKQATVSYQNGKVQMLGYGQSLPGGAIVLNSSSGLIGMPSQTLQGIFARCLLNPAIKIGTQVKIDQKDIQGAYAPITATGARTNNASQSGPYCNGRALYSVQGRRYGRYARKSLVHGSADGFDERSSVHNREPGEPSLFGVGLTSERKPSMNVWSALRSLLSLSPAPAAAPPLPPIEDRTPPIPSRIPRPDPVLGSAEAVNLLGMYLAAFGTRTPVVDHSQVNPFDASRHRPPPCVRGKSGSALAMDEAAGVSQWALEGINGFIGPREGFIGYPELAMLAQVPEYRSPVEIIATESTREWIKFTSRGDADKSDKIAKIEAEFKRLDVQSVFRQVSEYDGFYGRGHIYIDIGTDLNDSAELKMPIGDGEALSKLKIGKGGIKELRAIEPVWVWPNAYNSVDPLSRTWYRPETWFVMAKEVHKSRILTFVAREVPDLLKPAYMFGGQSLTQMLRPVVENWLTTRAAVGEIVKRFTHNVVKLNVTEAINSGNADKLFRRIKLFNDLKGNFGTMALDVSEEFINVSIPLTGLDLLQAQAQEHIASLSRIPVIKLLGIQPAGLNASSAGELRAFEDSIHSYQEAFFRPNLKTVLNLVQISLFGEVDQDISFEFETLAEELDELGKAQAAQQVTSGVSSAFENGVIDRPTALREIKAQLEGLGIASAISEEMIAEAENEPPAPSPEEMKAQAMMIKAEGGALQ